VNPVKKVLVDLEVGLSQPLELFFEVLPKQSVLKRMIVVVGDSHDRPVLVGLYIDDFLLEFDALTSEGGENICCFVPGKEPL
jgi:hypothetical protein